MIEITPNTQKKRHSNSKFRDQLQRRPSCEYRDRVARQFPIVRPNSGAYLGQSRSCVITIDCAVSRAEFRTEFSSAGRRSREKGVFFFYTLPQIKSCVCVFARGKINLQLVTDRPPLAHTYACGFSIVVVAECELGKER